MSEESKPQEIVPLKSRVQHKFYEPIILLEALNFATRDTAEPVSQAESLNTLDPERFFQIFVYKLAHLCDYMKYGSTVTSFVIVHDDHDAGTFIYKFAANNQQLSQLEKTRQYVENLLMKIDQMVGASCDRHPLRAKIEQDVLVFNKPRIMIYLRELQAHLKSCLKVCQDNESEENATIYSGLAKIESSLRIDLQDREMADSTFAEGAYTVISELGKFQKSTAGELIANRAREGRDLAGYRSSHSELQHTISRLVAYPISVRFLIQARKMWPRLFRDFGVSFVPSSQPAPRVFRLKSRTAEGIIGRMTRNAEIMATFKAWVKALQEFGLDARIQEAYQNPSFRPIVHSELLLLNWLHNSGGGLRPERFLNGWMFIGASKPTCRLCHYYVQEHPSAVQVRATHGNIYTHWRVPDVVVADGPEAVAARDAMVDKMLLRIRKDAFDMVQQKVPSSYKQQVHSFLPCSCFASKTMLTVSASHDSNTFSARLTTLETTTVNESSVSGELDDITSRVSDMGLAD